MILKNAIILLTVVLMAQCRNEVTSTQAQSPDKPMQQNGQTFGQEIYLSNQVQTKIGSGDAALTLEVTKLMDSRCPEGVNCIQYGNATVILAAGNKQGRNERITLCIGDCQRGQAIRETDSITAFVGQTRYTFSLKEVTPYPGTEQQGDEKKVRLVVEQQQ